MSWFAKIVGKKPSRLLEATDIAGAPGGQDGYAELADRLVAYPAHVPPHPGNPLQLNDAQCDQNLADLLRQRDHRLECLAAFLRTHNIEILSILDGGQAAVRSFADIHAWLLNWLPKRPFDIVSGDQEPNPPYDRFMASDRAGSDIFLSLLSDLALLEGEAIHRIDSRFAWEVNRWPEHIDLSSEDDPDTGPHSPTDHPDYRHICLIMPSNDPNYWPTMLNLHKILQYQCHAMMSPMGYTDAPYGSNYENALGHRFEQGGSR
ncbi:MAG: hypothetical protein ACRCY3_02045 [Sphingorhabdus sp.]